jgi:hypothetical protein
MKTKMKVMAQVAVLVLASAVTSQAAISVVGRWSFNEVGAANGNDIASGLNTGTSPGFNMIQQLGPNLVKYSNDVPSGSVDPLAPSFSASFGAVTTNYFASSSGSFTNSDNIGMELWVKSGVASQSSNIFSNSSIDGKGFNILQQGTNYSAVVQGNAVFGSTAASTSQWTHLALVYDSGAFGGTNFYVNGVLNATLSGAYVSTLGGSAQSIYMGAGFSAASPFSGLVADARIFTFTSGQFNTSDLNVVPEPSTYVMVLGGLLTLFVLARRRHSSAA